ADGGPDPTGALHRLATAPDHPTTAPDHPATAPHRPAGDHIVLINPNTSAATTAMMTTIARRALGGGGRSVRGVTADRGPGMLT
ncbi:hypothetical protein GTW71_00830, partial [Streptomyces sp. SID6041]|nr:hypothetical protein [Streptomyces sp. SID6041]